MIENRPVHADFYNLLKHKDEALIDLYTDIRDFVLSLHPEANELLYHTHALTSVYSVSDKLGDAYCMIPIYTNHLNLGFNKGTLLLDPHKLLQGTGSLIRHIPVRSPEDYMNVAVEQLIRAAIELAVADMGKPSKVSGKVISKIKLK